MQKRWMWSLAFVLATSCVAFFSALLAARVRDLRRSVAFDASGEDFF
jgi:hypothetical protein